LIRENPLHPFYPRSMNSVAGTGFWVPGFLCGNLRENFAAFARNSIEKQQTRRLEN